MPTRTFGPCAFETSNEDKALFGDDGPTKGDLIDYYARIADTMLPHMAGRPITMHRFPDGIDADGFYQKDAPDYFPEWIANTRQKKEGGTVDYVLCENAATLAYLANQACITPHVWLSRHDEPDHPDRVVLDLDPADDDFDAVRDAARRVADLLEEIGLVPFFQTTGSRGVHVVAPIRRGPGFDDTRALARDAMRLLASRHDDALTTEVRKGKRRGRLFLDTARNAYAQTMVTPYAVRARPHAPVATPISRRELDASDLGARTYTTANIFRRLGQTDDPWRDIDRHARDLEPARDRLDRIAS